MTPRTVTSNVEVGWAQAKGPYGKIVRWYFVTGVGSCAVSIQVKR